MLEEDSLHPWLHVCINNWRSLRNSAFGRDVQPAGRYRKISNHEKRSAEFSVSQRFAHALD